MCGFGGARNGVRHGIAQAEADQGGEEGCLQRVQIGDTVHFIRQQIPVVREGDGQLQVTVSRVRENIREWRDPGRGLSQADLEGERERDEKEDCQEDERWKDDEPAARTR